MMKVQHIVSTLTIGLMLVTAHAATSRVIRHNLDENTSYSIPANPNITTTVVFPKTVFDMNGSGFQLEESASAPPPTAEGQAPAPQVMADFLVRWSDGQNYFSITPTTDTVRARNLNVVVEGKVFAIEFRPSNNTESVPAVVHFDDTNHLWHRPSGTPLVIKNASAPKPTIETSGAAQIIGALDTMRMMQSMPSDQMRVEAVSLLPDAQLVINDPPISSDFGNMSVNVESVLRLDDKDILVFAVTIENKTKQPVLLDTESFTVSVGTQEPIAQVTADVPPVIAAQSQVRGVIAIIGSAHGTPNRFSPHNDFRIGMKWQALTSDEGNSGNLAKSSPTPEPLQVEVSKNPGAPKPTPNPRPEAPPNPTPTSLPPTPIKAAATPEATPIPTPTPAPVFDSRSATLAPGSLKSDANVLPALPVEMLSILPLNNSTPLVIDESLSVKLNGDGDPKKQTKP